MIAFRCAAFAAPADARGEGGALWFPRPYQGDGRHDNPGLYGCLYLSEREVSAVAERLQVFRGQRRLATWMLEREGRALTVAAIEVPDDVPLVDLDEPRVLARERLRPSRIATRDRAATQADAAALFERHADAAGLRWWSTLESSWPNLTLFDRAAPRLVLRELRPLTVFDAVVREAAELLGLG